MVKEKVPPNTESTAQEELDKVKEGRYKAALKTLTSLDAVQLEDVILGAESELAKHEPDQIGNLLLDLYTIRGKIDEREKTWGMVGGISTGLPSLDAAIGGLKEGELVLIGGKPKNGKSALAQNIASNVAREHPILYITLELLAEDTGVRVKHINGGKHHEEGRFIVQSSYDFDYRHLKPLFQQAKDSGAKVAVLDYLQFMGRGHTNEEVAKMSKSMKLLALEFAIPFIVIVSLRKGDTKFTTKWVDFELDDIMGTSAIGYDADAVMICSRKNEDNEFDADHLYVKVVAVRSMPDSGSLLWYDWDKTRVTEPAVSFVVDRGASTGTITDDGHLAYKD